MSEIIQVIVVDDHPLVLRGFEYILAAAKDMQLSRSFEDAREAIAFLENAHVDVVLLDINMPNMDGFQAIQTIQKHYPDIHVIAISNLNEASVATRMLQHGAAGYLLKNVSADELIAAIHAVCRGEKIIAQEMQDMLKQADHTVPIVTRREQEILLLLAKGFTTSKIADDMFISPLTVESHRRNLLQKFKVTNVASLIHRATEMKFI
ncbi:response regulator transcription factor [Sphingobacterium sp. lm-10]|uniref:response regulator transcription factor n=1 Tax=Sphingobacterium sp. lm-10 TaxID=2944904 RepID=UPI0020221DDC|nr:response regulator transcription factor [Sphingobacterium sp. lm-10]MCL7986937.1 response regulator transcription factor [Sphingobacterium sp. lm-10]